LPLRAHRAYCATFPGSASPPPDAPVLLLREADRTLAAGAADRTFARLSAFRPALHTARAAASAHGGVADRAGLRRRDRLFRLHGRPGGLAGQDRTRHPVAGTRPWPAAHGGAGCARPVAASTP